MQTKSFNDASVKPNIGRPDLDEDFSIPQMELHAPQYPDALSAKTKAKDDIKLSKGPPDLDRVCYPLHEDLRAPLQLDMLNAEMKPRRRSGRLTQDMDSVGDVGSPLESR